MCNDAMIGKKGAYSEAHAHIGAVRASENQTMELRAIAQPTGHAQLETRPRSWRDPFRGRAVSTIDPHAVEGDNP